jgi:hypothetical protein
VCAWGTLAVTLQLWGTHCLCCVCDVASRLRDASSVSSLAPPPWVSSTAVEALALVHICWPRSFLLPVSPAVAVRAVGDTHLLPPRDLPYSCCQRLEYCGVSPHALGAPKPWGPGEVQVALASMTATPVTL